VTIRRARGGRGNTGVRGLSPATAVTYLRPRASPRPLPTDLTSIAPGQPGSSSLFASFLQPRCLRSQPTDARWYVAVSS
jgi:hypothetical protein